MDNFFISTHFDFKIPLFPIPSQAMSPPGDPAQLTFTAAQLSSAPKLSGASCVNIFAVTYSEAHINA